MIFLTISSFIVCLIFICSPTTASLYSPDSSDSEDSMLSFKVCYSLLHFIIL